MPKRWRIRPHDPAAIAGQLPARLTCRLLGYPEHMWPQLKSWSERLMRIDMRERDGATFTEFIDANMEFVEALMPVAAAARQEQGLRTRPAQEGQAARIGLTEAEQPLMPQLGQHR